MEDTVYPLDGKKGYFLGEVDSVTLTPHKRPRQRPLTIHQDSERNSHCWSPFTLGHHLPTVGAYSEA